MSRVCPMRPARPSFAASCSARPSESTTQSLSVAGVEGRQATWGGVPTHLGVGRCDAGDDAEPVVPKETDEAPRSSYCSPCSRSSPRAPRPLRLLFRSRASRIRSGQQSGGPVRRKRPRRCPVSPVGEACPSSGLGCGRLWPGVGYYRISFGTHNGTSGRSLSRPGTAAGSGTAWSSSRGTDQIRLPDLSTRSVLGVFCVHSLGSASWHEGEGPGPACGHPGPSFSSVPRVNVLTAGDGCPVRVFRANICRRFCRRWVSQRCSRTRHGAIRSSRRWLNHHA